LTLLAVMGLVFASCGGGKGTGSGATSGVVAHDYAQFAGLADHTITHGDDCIGDVNGDGHLDVLLNSHTDQWQLLYGTAGGKFVPSHIPIPLHDRHGCVFADFNGDGLLDIYFAIGDCKGRICRNKKELWIQRPNHTFVNEAAQWGITDPGGRGRVPIVVNANGDKRPDLFTGEEIGVDFPSANKLWINAGNHFVLHSGPPTIEIGNNCSAAADLTHDGLDDIGVCTPTKGFHLYRAVGKGNYVEDNAGFGIPSFGNRAVRFADLNHDGWADVVSVNQAGVQVRLNDHGHFGNTVFTFKAGDVRDAAVGDCDGDGNPDLYVQRYQHPDEIFFGDGRGGFQAGPIVPKRNGVAESVTVLPHWHNGHDAFIVNNGYEYSQGTRQLIACDGTRPKS
jgi:hypothetical protein